MRTVVEYLESIDNMQAYLAYHNYGQMYMVPYGFQQEPPPDFDELVRNPIWLHVIFDNRKMCKIKYGLNLYLCLCSYLSYLDKYVST